MAGVRAYKVAAVALVIVIISLSGAAAYYYQQQGTQVSRAADLNSQLDSYKAQVDDLTSQKSSLNTKIDSLNAQISSDVLQIQQLKAWLSGNSSANAQLLVTNAQLQLWLNGNVTDVQALQSTVSLLTQELTQTTTQLAQAEAKLAKLEAANLKGNFMFSNSCPFLFGNCSYMMDGAYANIGNSTATSASVSFTFFSGAVDTGQVLCTTTDVLGNVSAQSVATMGMVSCAGDSSTQANSAAFLFSWT